MYCYEIKPIKDVDFSCINVEKYNLSLAEYLKIELACMQVVASILELNKISFNKKFEYRLGWFDTYENNTIPVRSNNFTDFEYMLRKCLRSEGSAHIYCGKPTPRGNYSVEIRFGFDMKIFITSKKPIDFDINSSIANIYDMGLDFWKDINEPI